MSNFLNDIYRTAALSPSECETLHGLHTFRKAKIGEKLLIHGEKADYYWVVECGLLRSLVISPGGKDITTQFYAAGEIALEFNGFFLRNRCLESIEVLSDAHLWQVTHQDFAAFMKAHGPFGTWGRNWMVNGLLARERFHLSMHTEPARERYIQLMQERPEVIQLSPLKYIASYLGITDSSMSRLRKHL